MTNPESVKKSQKTGFKNSCKEHKARVANDCIVVFTTILTDFMSTSKGNSFIFLLSGKGWERKSLVLIGWNQRLVMK